MSSDLTTADVERHELRSSLAQLLGASEELERLLGEQFDELEALHAHLVERQCELDARRSQVDRQLDTLCESQARLDDAGARAEKQADDLRELTARLTGENDFISASEITALRDERDRLRGEAETARTQTNFAIKDMAGDLAGARAELVAAAEALERQRAQLAAIEAPIRQAILAGAQLSQSQPDQEHDVGAAADSAAGADHERLAGTGDDEQTTRDRATWWDELKQLRGSLSKTSGRLAKRGVAATGGAAPLQSPVQPDGQTATLDDPVLSSVMAQFEMLQNELVRGQGMKHPAGK